MENIKYNGKEYPVKIGYYALKHTSKELAEKTNNKDMSMEDVLSGDITVYEPLLYYSLVMGAKVMNTELDIEREEMEFVLDGCLFDFQQMVIDSFPKPQEVGKQSKAV